MSPTIYSPSGPDLATLTHAQPAAARNRTAGTRGRTAAKLLMAALSALVATYAIALVALPAMRPPLMQQRFDTAPIATTLHLALGALVIVLAPLQLSTRLRRRFNRAHRWSGRAYALGVLFSGLAGLALAAISHGGTPAHLGFALLALAWLATTALGVQRILAGDVRGHEEWMIRSAALTFAAVTLRIYLPLAVVLELPSELAYQAIAWLCWVPNAVVAEWVVRRARP